MGMGGSDVEQQAQYHPRGVSSALLFTINASGSRASGVWHHLQALLSWLHTSRGRKMLPVVVEAECQAVCPFCRDDKMTVWGAQ